MRDLRNWRKIAHWIEGHVAHGLARHDMGRGREQKRIAVRRSLQDRPGTHRAIATRTVLDHDLGAVHVLEFLGVEACQRIDGTAGGEWDNHAHRSRGIGLRAGEARDSGQRGRARGQMQELAAGKFHGERFCLRDDT